METVATVAVPLDQRPFAVSETPSVRAWCIRRGHPLTHYQAQFNVTACHCGEASLRLVSPSTAVDPEVHTPERVKAYLAGLGFRLVDESAVRATFEVWGCDEFNLVIQTIPTAPDYRKTLGHLASVLADEYGTGELGILAAIANQTETEEF